eukprot:1147753-Pelagomonas_calceolata.AAC.5
MLLFTCARFPGALPETNRFLRQSSRRARNKRLFSIPSFRGLRVQETWAGLAILENVRYMAYIYMALVNPKHASVPHPEAFQGGGDHKRRHGSLRVMAVCICAHARVYVCTRSISTSEGRVSQGAGWSAGKEIDTGNFPHHSSKNSHMEECRKVGCASSYPHQVQVQGAKLFAKGS